MKRTTTRAFVRLRDPAWSLAPWTPMLQRPGWAVGVRVTSTTEDGLPDIGGECFAINSHRSCSASYSKHINLVGISTNQIKC